MTEQRKNTRYLTFARAHIEGVTREDAIVKDISITGCCVELPSIVTIAPNEKYKLKIIPEDEAKIDPFFLSVEAKWIGTEVDSYEFGFNIIESPKGKQFQRYVDYLSWRYSRGNSMTGDGDSDIIPMV